MPKSLKLTQVIYKNYAPAKKTEQKFELLKCSAERFLSECPVSTLQTVKKFDSQHHHRPVQEKRLP